MIGENYPEKELLKNDLELILRGCNAVVFVPFLIAYLPQREDKMDSVSGRWCDPTLGEACLIFSSSRRQASYEK